MSLSPFVWAQRAAETPSVALQPAEIVAALWAHEGWLDPAHVRPSVSRPYSPLPPPLASRVPAAVLEATGLAAVRFPAVDLHEAAPTAAAVAPPAEEEAGFRLWGITLGISSDLVVCADRPSLNKPPVYAENALAQALITLRMHLRARWPGWSHVTHLHSRERCVSEE
jgi:hypothetical protein